MKSILLFVSLTASFQLTAQQKMSIKDSLQGVWNYSELRIENSDLLTPDRPYEDEFRYYTPYEHWIIRENHIYEIDYPCCLIDSYTFKIQNGILLATPVSKTNKFNRNELLYSLSIGTDSLVLYEMMFGRVMTFFKDTLPEKEVSELIKGKVNPECFYGDWEIPTGEVSVPYDAIVISYPWKMPETLHIDSTNINQYWRKNQFYLPVDGVNRPFEIMHVSLYNDDFTIVPGNWKKQYIKKDEYYNVEDVWLRKINDD